MTLQVVLLFLGGVLYGAIIGYFGFKMLNTAVMKAHPRNENETRILKRRIQLRCWLRILIDAVALFVLFKIPPMLLGAALGMIVVQKVFIIKTIKN